MQVTLYTYMGVKQVIARHLSLIDAHALAKSIRRKHDGPVSTIKPNEWELQTPDNASCIRTCDGILTLERDS